VLWFNSYKRPRCEVDHIIFIVRDIVKAAHLQPLEKKDLTRVATDHQPWNSFTTSSDNDGQSTTLDLPRELPKKPRNCQEFLREWRKLNNNITAKNRCGSV